MPDRKAAEKAILDLVNKLDPAGGNAKEFKAIFAKMSDKDFHNFMVQLREEKAYLPFFAPLDDGPKQTVASLLEIAESVGVPIFEKLVYTGNERFPDHATPFDVMVITLPIKRQSQLLVKKRSIPADNKTIDQLTYQPTGESKGAKISYPELQLLEGLGLEKTADELMRLRGGDKNGFNAYNAMFMRYGSAKIEVLNNYTSGVGSTNTLKAYLTAMHLSNTL